MNHESELLLVLAMHALDLVAVDCEGIYSGYCSDCDMTHPEPGERSLRKSIDTYSVLGPGWFSVRRTHHPHEIDFSLAWQWGYSPRATRATWFC